MSLTALRAVLQSKTKRRDELEAKFRLGVSLPGMDWIVEEYF